MSQPLCMLPDAAEGEHRAAGTGNTDVMLADKNQIRRSFVRAASTYDRQAHVQRQVAQRLLTLLQARGCKGPGRVLEVGSCTGLLSQALVERYPAVQELHLNDLAVELFPLVRKRLRIPGGSLRILAGDFESIRIAHRYDLIISSSTFHWFHDLQAALDKTADLLLPGGYLALGMYGWGNLEEVRVLTGRGLDYVTLARLQGLLASRFHILAAEETCLRIWFPSVQALLLHLRQSGVNCLTGGAWSRGRLDRFVQEYEQRFREAQGVPLSYHPLYVIARRR